MMATPDSFPLRQTLPLLAGFWRWWGAVRHGPRGRWGWRWVALLCGLLLSGLAGAAPAAAPAEIRLDEATASSLTLAQASLAPGLHAPGAAGGDWRDVALDHPWARAGWCDAPLSTYRVRFTWVPDPALGASPVEGATPLADQALLIHRAGSRVAVWLNQDQMLNLGPLDNPRADHSNLPLLVTLPRHLLQPGENLLTLQVAGDCRRLAGLSRMTLGPHGSLSTLHARETGLSLYPAIAMISLSLMMTLAGLAYLRGSPSRVAIDFTWGSFLWMLSTVLWLCHDLPGPFGMWLYAVEMTYGMAVVRIARLLMRLSDTYNWHRQLTLWLLLAHYAVFQGLVAMGWALAYQPIGIVLNLLGYVFLSSQLYFVTWREPTESRLVVSLAVAPIFALGALDQWHYFLSPDFQTYSMPYLSPVLAMLLLMALCLVMMRQYQQALRSDRQYQAVLEREVALQRQHLEAHHRLEQQQAKGDAVQSERQRIVRDMHDGLGAQLSGLLKTVRSDGVTPDALEDELSQAMEQLRATMDSLGSQGQDLSTVLAQFRFLHQPRLERAGVRLVWRVQPLPDTEWPPAAIWHMQQMLREVFANIVRHAGATTVTVTVMVDGQDGACQISIQDDGRGFDPKPPAPGSGLAHLAERARMLGVTLAVDSRPGDGCLVSWRWPQDHVPPGLAA